jgi:GIY-YIG catalytic domain
MNAKGKTRRASKQPTNAIAQPPKSAPPPQSTTDDVSALPFEVEELNKELVAFLATPFDVPGARSPRGRRLGSLNWGVYVFFDYDGEPIYVGQTKEKIGTRVRRHLTGRRTDAVAKNILDPYEVCMVRVYPLPQFQSVNASDTNAIEHLNALEYIVFHELLEKSQFKAILNEKMPPEPKRLVTVPEYVERRVASVAVTSLRDHPDTRIARRAQTLATLAKGISERKVGLGIRRTLLTQAKRLQWLAERRLGQAPDVAEDDADE